MSYLMMAVQALYEAGAAAPLATAFYLSWYTKVASLHYCKTACAA
jgi:hypothetical protein